MGRLLKWVAVGGSFLSIGAHLFASTWTGAIDSTWNNASNWTDGIPNAVGAQALFGSGLPATTVDLAGGPFIVGTLNIADNTNVITIGTAAAPGLTLQANAGNAQLGFAGSGAHVIVANLALNSSVTLTQNATSGVTISGAISGANGFTKEGAQILTLSGINTATGAIALNAGTTRITNISTFTGGITVNHGAILELQGGGTLGAAVPIAVNEGTFTLGVNTATGTLSGTGGTINLNANSLSVTQGGDQELASAIIGTGGITKLGTNALILSGANTYSGATTVSAGTLVITNDASIGASSGLTLGDGTQLRLTASPTSGITFSNGVTLSGGNATINTNGRELTLSGTVTGAASLTKVGAGTLFLSGANLNNYSLGTFLNAGVIKIDDVNSLGTGTLTMQGGTLEAGASLAITNLITLSANSEIDTANTILSLGGVISSTGAFSLTKRGTGTLLLPAGVVNTYTGNTVLTQGILNINNPNSLGTGAGTLVMQGGTLEAGTSITVANPVTLATNGIISTPGTDLVLSGVIDGSGSLTKEGSGKLTLTAANSYQGVTRVNVGTLSVASATGLGNSSEIILGGGTLEVTGATTFNQRVRVIANSVIDTSSAVTLNLGVNGIGSLLTKDGVGALTLRGVNTLGDLLINAGSVTFDAGIGPQLIGSLSGTGDFAFNDNRLRINQGSNTTFSGMFSGSGQLTKVGGGALTLSGASTLGGPLVMDSGALNFTGTLSAIGSLSGAGGTLNFDANTVTINQTSSGIFAGDLTGTGTVTKAGAASLTLSGANTFTGTFEIDAGTLFVDGSLSATDTNVNSGAIARGIGQYTKLNVLSGGIVNPGNLVNPQAVLTVQTDYNQASGSRLQIDINTLNSNSVSVGQTATINAGAILDVMVQGSCFKGQTFDILTANTITAPWDVLNFPPECELTLEIISNQIARLTELNTVLFIGTPIAPGNPTAVNDYLDCIEIVVSDAIVPVLAEASLLDDKGINGVLNQLHPGLFGAFELANLDNNALITSLLAEQLTRISCSRLSCLGKKENGERQNGWVTPLGSFTDIVRYEELRGFDTKSGGIVMGYDGCIPDRGMVGVGLGYYHTDLKWKQSSGDASINKAFGALYTGYSSKYCVIDLSVIGGANFYKVKRVVTASRIREEAKNNHNGYFFNPHLGVAFDFHAKREGIVRLFGTVDYAYLFQRGYSEGGSPAIDLKVKKKRSAMLRTEVGIRFAADMRLEKGCLYVFGSPSWVRKIPLDSGKYRAKLISFLDRPCSLVVDTFDSKKDLIGVDLGFIYTLGSIALSATYRGEFAHNYRVNQIEGKWQCAF